MSEIQNGRNTCQKMVYTWYFYKGGVDGDQVYQSKYQGTLVAWIRASCI